MQNKPKQSNDKILSLELKRIVSGMVVYIVELLILWASSFNPLLASFLAFITTAITVFLFYEVHRLKLFINNFGRLVLLNPFLLLSSIIIQVPMTIILFLLSGFDSTHILSNTSKAFNGFRASLYEKDIVDILFYSIVFAFLSNLFTPLVYKIIFSSFAPPSVFFIVSYIVFCIASAQAELYLSPNYNESRFPI